MFVIPSALEQKLEFRNILTLINPLLLLALLIPKPGIIKQNLKNFFIILLVVIIPIFTLYTVYFRLFFFLIPLLTVLGVAKLKALIPLNENQVRNRTIWALLAMITLTVAIFVLGKFELRSLNEPDPAAELRGIGAGTICKDISSADVI